MPSVTPSPGLHPPTGIDPTMLPGVDPTTPLVTHTSSPPGTDPTKPAGGSPDASHSLNLAGTEVADSLRQEFHDTAPIPTVNGQSGSGGALIGSSGDDLVIGATHGQELIGGGGNDCLAGGAGGMALFASNDGSHPSAGQDTAQNFNVLVGGPGDALVGGRSE